MSNLIRNKNEFSVMSNRGFFEIPPVSINPILFAEYRKQYKKAANLEELEHPVQIDIELNSTCNLKCKFCFQSKIIRKPKIMDFKTYKNIIDQAYDFGIRGIKLNYQNEPLLLDNLESYIEYAWHKGMFNIFISTNGILLNRERAKSLIDSGLTMIFISIDAFTEETYFNMRGSKKLSTLVNNILGFMMEKELRKVLFPLVRVNFLESDINKYEKPAFIHYWEHKVDMMIIQELNGEIKFNRDKNTYINKCSYPFKQMVVTAYGEILPCCPREGYWLGLGRVEDITLIDAWSCQRMKELRKMHKKGLYETNKYCRRCLNG